jgi:hypothetical protein
MVIFAKLKGHNLVAEDFLEYKPDPVYNMVIVNPPFEDDLDLGHDKHAWSCLKPGGILLQSGHRRRSLVQPGVTRNFANGTNSILPASKRWRMERSGNQALAWPAR